MELHPWLLRLGGSGNLQKRQWRWGEKDPREREGAREEEERCGRGHKVVAEVLVLCCSGSRHGRLEALVAAGWIGALGKTRRDRGKEKKKSRERAVRSGRWSPAAGDLGAGRAGSMLEILLESELGFGREGEELLWRGGLRGRSQEVGFGGVDRGRRSQRC